jgi:endonuclease/exonuclease/phosphatase family metal-dependent hydrolase
VRLLTWNIYFGGHMFEERRAALITELTRRRPEVCCLQEVTGDEDLAIPGYERNEDLAGLGYGTVIYTRVAVAGARSFDLPSQMGRRLVEVDLGGLVVASVHLESLDERGARLVQIGMIQQRLAKHERVVWCGDFNFTPDTPEQEALDGGWTDAWTSLRSEPGFTVDTEINTMRYQLKQRLTQKRIDRVLTRGITPRSIELIGTAPIDLDGTFVSDHFGLEVDLG